MKNHNLFHLPQHLPDHEIFETLAQGDNILIERIVSGGQSTPEGQWYDQEMDEWVGLLQGNARIRYEIGEDTVLQAGNWLLIPAHCKHRVESTSSTPPCIWLAIFGRLAPICHG